MTDVPTDPEFGFKLWMPGPDPTANTRPLLDSPATVTITGPVVAPVGTGTAILAGLQLVAVAKVPLKVTVLVPCAEPKFEPEIVTEVPVDPPLGDKFESTGTDAVFSTHAGDEGRNLRPWHRRMMAPAKSLTLG